jgi:hypothetical protein
VPARKKGAGPLAMNRSKQAVQIMSIKPIGAIQR